jgi:hypothetical protein
MRTKEKQRVKEVLFRESRGSSIKCDIPELSKRTGIPEATLRRYKREPDMIPLYRVLAIANGMGIRPEDAGYMITGRTKNG